MQIPFAQIDAFATRPFTGNPAAVMPLEAWLDDATLQAIAAENNLSETAFLVPDRGDTADFELRWFTPELEVALCGHATLASGHHVLTRPDWHREWVRFRTRRAGLLEVAREGSGYRMALPAYFAQPLPMPKVVKGLGLAANAVTDTLWHQDGYGIVVLRDADAVRAVAPDYAALGGAGDVLNIVTAPGDTHDVISRVFAPGAGIAEDPVTGSAHAVLAPYWAKRLGRPRFTAHQASARGGDLDVELDGDRVLLRGQCVTVIEGVFTV